MMLEKKAFPIIDLLAATLRYCRRNVSIKSRYELENGMSDLAINQALQACIHLRDFQRGMSIANQLSTRSQNSTHIQTSLIQLYTRRGDLKVAQRVFSSISSQRRTPFLYTAMINGLLWNNRNEDALTLLEEMTVKPDRFLFTTAFSMCANLGSERAIKLARKMFQQMPENDLKDTFVANSALNMFMKIGDVDQGEKIFRQMRRKDLISYGAMIKGYYSSNDPLKALNLFWQIKRDGIQVDVVMYVLAVQACSQMAMIEHCRSISDEIPKPFKKNQTLQNALIDMWGKAGLVDEAEKVFQSIENPDCASFGAMINAFGQNGMGARAVDLYRRISPQMRNNITNLCVLNACSHSGLLKEARSIFNNISPQTEKTTTAMVDCLSRVHEFDEAEQLIFDFEKVHPPYSPMYLAIMSSARTQFNSSISERLLLRMKELFPDLKADLLSATILLANSYPSTENSDRPWKLRKEIRESSLQPQVGRSWTCVNGQIFEFRAHDQSHPQSDEIYREIDLLTKELIQFSHKFDRRWITRALGIDETIESVLSSHSERLAVAFNLIQKTIPSPIQITQNLRMCGDCHAAVKLIARIRQRQIVIRDINRIHHFYPNGECSCKDFF